MQAAEKLFRARQFHEIALDDVAREAGVGKGTLYLYFTDKDDLFFQTAVAGFDDLCELLRQDATEGVPLREGLRKICERVSDYFRARRPLIRLILDEGQRALGRGGELRARWLQRRKSMTAVVADFIARGAKAGEIRADMPPAVLAEYFFGMLRTRAIELEDQPEASRSHAMLVDFFINGAAPKTGRKAGDAKQS